MTNESVEQRLQKLEEENKKLRHEIERAQAVTEIRNLVSTMQAYHVVGSDEKIAELSAKRPDSKVYFGELGSWEGVDCSERAAALHGGGPRPGFMALHLMCNPIIQVAGDGQTAQATFIAAGVVGMKDSKTGKPRAIWEWNRYGEDFIKEDGKWKIWHHHIYPLFKIDYDAKWEEQFTSDGPSMELPFKPDHPATPLDVYYNPDEELPLIPIPQPYETFDPKQGY